MCSPFFELFKKNGGGCGGYGDHGVGGGGGSGGGGGDSFSIIVHKYLYIFLQITP